MKTKTLVPFFAISFGLTWGIAALLILFADQVSAIFGEIGLSNPLIILAVYSPGFAGVFLAWRHLGLKGLGSFFQRLTIWRAPRAWWLFLLLGIPVVVYTGAAIKGTFSNPFPFSSWEQALPALLLALFLGPIEEFGWRGMALPLLQRKLSPFWAGLALGVAWALWHVPAFFIGGMPQTAWAAGPYFLGIVALSVIITPLFNASRGSLLIAVLYHFQLMNPIWPDAQPWDNLLFIGLAVIVVWLNRGTMFNRKNSITDVLMPVREEGSRHESGANAKKPLSATAG